MSTSISEVRSRLIKVRDAADVLIHQIDDRQSGHAARTLEGAPDTEAGAETPPPEGSVISGQVGFDIILAAIKAMDDALRDAANWWTQNKQEVDDALLPVEMRRPQPGDSSPGVPGTSRA